MPDWVCEVCKGESGGELVLFSKVCDSCWMRDAWSEDYATRILTGQPLSELPCWFHRHLVWVADAGDYLQLRSFADHLTSSESIGYADPSAAAPAAGTPPNTAQSGKGA